MGTITAQDLFDDAAEILQDTDFVRWTKPKMLRWLNAGQREVVIGDPKANTANTVVQLTAGTKQVLPDGGLALIDVTRNMGADKATPGRVPTFIARSVIDAQNPNWHKDSVSAVALHVIYDQRDKKHFYVYPPQPVSNPGSLELIYSAAPLPVATEDNSITLDDIYANALVNYLLYRAYNLDPVSIAKSSAYYQAFLMLVLGKEKTDKTVQPSAQTEG